MYERIKIMQADDMWLTQPPDPKTCPLCSKPLTSSETSQSQSQQTMVTCLSCGFSAPFVQRRHREDQHQASTQDEQAAAALSSRLFTKSSVWIDPAVSAFLGGQIVDSSSPVYSKANASTYPSLLPSLPQEPKKQQVSPTTPLPPMAPQ